MTNFIDSKQIIENLVTKDTPLVEQEFFSNLNESNQIIFLNKLKKACSFVNGWANNNFVNYLKEKVLTLTFEELNPVTGEMTNEFIYRLEDILVYPEGIIAWLTENGSDPQNNSASTFLPQYASNWAQAIWMIAIHWFKNNTSPDENVLGGQGVSFSDSPNSTFSKENDVIQNYVPQDAYQLLKVNKFVEWYKGNKLNQTIYDQQFLTKSDLTSVETQIDKNTEAIADQQNQINNLEVSGGVSEEDLITTKIFDKENSDAYGYSIYQSDLNTRFENRINQYYQEFNEEIGSLNSLNTNAKDNIVNSINEINSNLEIETIKNNSQDISILENSNNILALEGLINNNLLFSNRLVDGNPTIINTTPINLPLPNVDIESIFETLDGGITFTLKSGFTLKAGTRIYWEQVFNFLLTQVSANDRGILTSYVNGTPYTIKEIDIVPNQTNGSFLAKSVYNIITDTATLTLTSNAQATNGNFTATLLKNSYIVISSQNTTASVGTTTSNITYSGTVPSIVGQNQTIIDDSFSFDIENLKLLIETLKMPIGSKVITNNTNVPFTYGTWALIGQLGNKDTIIGYVDDSLKGQFDLGDIKSHTHKWANSIGKKDVNQGGSSNVVNRISTWNSAGSSYNVSLGGDGPNATDETDLYTFTTGTDKNYPSGLNIGISFIWERIS